MNEANYQLGVPASISEIINELVLDLGDPSRCYVWRGQSRFDWQPYPSLYRRLLKSGFAETDITESLVRAYEDDLFCEANGLGYYLEAGGNRLGLMVQLQHMGGATRLLDVTRDPFVAMWFAAHNNEEYEGIVYRYAIDYSGHALRETVFTWDDITDPALIGRPILYSPNQINERIKAQSAAFLSTVLSSSLSEGSIFTQTTDLISVKTVCIPSNLKKELREYLLRSRGIRSYDLFPDFQGFASANSANAAFPRDIHSLYSSKEEQGMFPARYNPTNVDS